MNPHCELTEKISQLIDGELAPEETSRVRAHLLVCPICRAAHSQFLELRASLHTAETPTDFNRQVQALKTILATDKKLTWRHPLFIPWPATVGLVLISFLGGITFQSVINLKGSQSRVSEKRIQPVANPPAARGENRPFARFDRGERAELLVIRQPVKGEVTQ
ncbi:MAG TPA: zf-HC2 domain-containing protein [Acidobacteriota bacterium]|nr:zf-HC2 domain-containing protein [Acidobacteriota bacterium]